MTLLLPHRRPPAPTWLRDPLWTRARMVPAFDIDANWGPTPVDRVSGLDLTTFTRTASATYVDRDLSLQTAGSNVLRRQWDATNRRWGWLVEEARTNNLTWSEDASQWLTATNLTVTTNQTTAPDGTSTADQYLETSATGLHVQDGTPSAFVTNTVYTYSVFVKSINGRNFEIGFPPTRFTDRFARFNLTTGTVQGTDAGVTAGIQALANGWFRCWATSTCVSGVSARVGNFVNDSSFSRNYTGNTANGIFIWGAQLEAGAFPASYIPTTSTTATRDADVWNWLSIPSVRSLYAEFTSPASGARGVASLNDNSSSQRVALNTSGTDPLLTVVDGGVTQANIDAGTITANTVNRMAARFGTNDFAASINGGAEGVDTAGTLPVVDRMFIGRSQAGEYLNGSISRLTGFARPLPVTQEMAR